MPDNYCVTCGRCSACGAKKDAGVTTIFTINNNAGVAAAPLPYNLWQNTAAAANPVPYQTCDHVRYS